MSQKYKKALSIVIIGLAVATMGLSAIAQECQVCELSRECTSFIVGKDASADGSTMVTHTADCGVCDFRLVYVPAKDYEVGAMRPIYVFSEPYPRLVDGDRAPAYAPLAGQSPSEPLGYIPQVAHTYAYFDGVYGVMNEHQLAIGETTAAANNYCGPVPENLPMIHVDELSRIAMERCTTAREAIQLMGDLAVEYGYYGFGENLTVIDPEEAWVFEITASPDNKSAIWAAQRVPDDEVAVIPNMFVIREIDFDSPDYFMYCPQIKEIALEQGAWTEGEPFDYLRVYTFGEYGNPYYSVRRLWQGMMLLAPSLDLNPYCEDAFSHGYPFSFKPDEPVTVEKLFEVQANAYQGTEFDLTTSLAAGPFGTPNRFAGGDGESLFTGAWERPIGIFRCSYSFVLQARSWLPDPIGGICWFGPDTARTTVYVPFYCGVTELPESYQIGSLREFDRNASWWAFDFVSNWADLKYSYMIEDITAKKLEIQSKERAMQPAIEQAAVSLHEKDPALAVEFLTDYCVNNANAVVSDWWEFSDFMIMKYNDGYINYPELGQGVGYPAWWLEAVKYNEGPTEYGEPEE
jgi:dipeptidase